MAKKQMPQCSVVPGMLSGIDYAELIKRDGTVICETVNAPKKEQIKQKVYSKNNKSRKK